MLRFLRRFRRGSQRSPSKRFEHPAADEELATLFRPLRSIQPDAAARARSRAQLLAAVAETRTNNRKPRLAGVRALTLAAAGLAGSTALVASAATGSDPATMVRDVAGWSATVLDDSPVTERRESVTVRSYDMETRIIEATTDAGEELRIVRPESDAGNDTEDEPLTAGTRIDVSLDEGKDSEDNLTATDVDVVSTPAPDMAMEPATEKTPRTEDAASGMDPHRDAVATEEPISRDDPSIAANDDGTDPTDPPVVATLEPEPTKPLPSDGDENFDGTSPVSTRPPRNNTSSPTPVPTEPPAATDPANNAPTPTPTSTPPDDDGDSSAANQNLVGEGPDSDATEDGDGHAK